MHISYIRYLNVLDYSTSVGYEISNIILHMIYDILHDE